MTLANRNLVTIDDLTNGEIEAVFSLADDMAESLDKQLDVCRGKILASLFFEPSTRTRLSFEAAMQRLGGSVISVAEGTSTSMVKGERPWGATPALNVSKRSPARSLSSASAIWLRARLPVQTKRTRRFINAAT